MRTVDEALRIVRVARTIAAVGRAIPHVLDVQRSWHLECREAVTPARDHFASHGAGGVSMHSRAAHMSVTSVDHFTNHAGPGHVLRIRVSEGSDRHGIKPVGADSAVLTISLV